jgi:hypothetical protein
MRLEYRKVVQRLGADRVISEDLAKTLSFLKTR